MLFSFNINGTDLIKDMPFESVSKMKDWTVKVLKKTSQESVVIVTDELGKRLIFKSFIVGSKGAIEVTVKNLITV